MNSSYLEMQLAILLMQYGNSTFMQALANASNMSVKEIETKLADIKGRRSEKPKKEKKTIVQMADEVITGDNKEMLHELALRYQNKQFLPQLFDVKRLLREAGISDEPKTRLQAVQIVFKTLSSMTLVQLNELTQLSDNENKTPFALLADKIIDGGNNKTSN